MRLVCIGQTIANIKAGSKVLKFPSFQQLTKFAKLEQPHLIVNVNWDMELRGPPPPHPTSPSSPVIPKNVLKNCT